MEIYLDEWHLGITFQADTPKVLTSKTKSKDTFVSQLSPEIFDQRKMDSNFLDANFGYFRLSTARDDENDENCPSYF